MKILPNINNQINSCCYHPLSRGNKYKHIRFQNRHFQTFAFFSIPNGFYMAHSSQVKKRLRGLFLTLHTIKSRWIRKFWIKSLFGNFEKEKWDRKAGRPRPAGDFSPVRGILRPVWYDDGLQIILKLDGTIPHPTDWASFLPIKGTIAIFSLQLSCRKTKRALKLKFKV